MDNGHIRLCPGCGLENPATSLRCSCGVLLAGVDVTTRQAATTAVTATPTSSPEPIICPYEDCGQENPAQSIECVYCGRALSTQATTETLQSLVNLPSALKSQYRIHQPMPTRGAEAELLLVEPLTGGPLRVAKIYRHGILPNREVLNRISQIPLAHRVEILAEGVSDGYAYEVMEYCQFGSLRQQITPGPFPEVSLQALIAELATALRDVHAVGLVHRDLKPENILLRQRYPLDLVLTDFGIASVMDSTQRFTGVARTLPYAAPESLSGVIDVKADYWSMGMIVLECITGQHPFAGLSEAVILHHLTTRPIELNQIRDTNLRKLLRGLLQRDPELRWGATEIERWLQHDTSLPEPTAQGHISSFNAPYQLLEHSCYTPEQLASALSQHWQEGIADLSNGQLLAWFRDEQKDQNVVRLLMNMRNQPDTPLELQLLKLIMHLAPGLPPVWKGETITLATILSYASKALQGDQLAARWLDNLYYFKVLSLYAQVGNASLSELHQGWTEAVAQYQQQQSIQNQVLAQHRSRDSDIPVNFDELVYGGIATASSNYLEIHPNLLALLYDQQWADKLRALLRAELTKLACLCSWVTELGDVQHMDVAALLVIDRLLPQIKQQVAQLQQHQLRQQIKQQESLNSLQQELDIALQQINNLSDNHFISTNECYSLQSLTEQVQQQLLDVQSKVDPSSDWQRFKQRMQTKKHTLNQLQLLLNQLEQQRIINASWFSGEVLIIALPITIVLVIMFHWLMIAVICILLWRLYPDYALMREIRQTGRSL